MVALPSFDPGIEISVFSQGMSKGLRQSDGVQILVRPELAIGSLLLDAYYKNVTLPAADGEAAVRLGLRHRFAGFDLAVSAAYKWNTNAHLQPDRDALEFSASASRRFGRITPHLSLVYSPDDLGGTRASLYAEAGASASLLQGLSFSANIERRERDGGPDYVAFNAGATYTLTRNLSADLRYYDTAQSRLGAIYRPRLVASLKLHF
ncbi:MAG: porin [Sphingomonadaceae bacterium]|nr:porin [Sphingomonadaceae bacterium]